MQVCSSWAGVPQHSDTRQAREHCSQQLEPLAREFRCVQKYPGEVPPGPPVAFSEALGHWVGREIYPNNRDGGRAGRGVSCASKRCTDGTDEVDLEPHELSSGLS